MLVISQCQGYKGRRSQLQQPSIELFGNKIVPVRVRRGKTYQSRRTETAILMHSLLLVGRVSQPKQGKPDCLQGVLGESLAQQEPPEVSHVVWLVSLACRRADKHHRWLIEQLGLEGRVRDRKCAMALQYPWISWNTRHRKSKLVSEHRQG